MRPLGPYFDYMYILTFEAQWFPGIDWNFSKKLLLMEPGVPLVATPIWYSSHQSSWGEMVLSPSNCQFPLMRLKNLFVSKWLLVVYTSGALPVQIEISWINFFARWQRTKMATLRGLIFATHMEYLKSLYQNWIRLSFLSNLILRKLKLVFADFR